jgi:6-phosphogluconolactonase
VVQHYGHSVNPQRQQEPHAHQIITDPSNRYAFVPDLGLDKIMIYEFDAENGKLKPAQQPWAEIHAGAGPRHFVFHPSGGFAYAINELDSTITVFTYQDGKLETIQTLPTLPEDFSGNSSTAAIKCHPSGKFVYGSNRWHDTIAIFACDQTTGKLSPLGYEPTQGGTPRDFDIDPTGTIMLVANQDTHTIVSYRIDPDTGLLSPSGQIAEVPSPVCVLIVGFWPD